MHKKIEKISKEKLIQSNKLNFKMDYTPPKYYSSFFNTVNKDAHSSRPQTVGLLSTDIFPEYLSQTSSPNPDNWKDFYLRNYLPKYETGLKKFMEKFECEKAAINNVQREDLINWYNDLMFNKTFAGLYVQDAILQDIASKQHAEYKKPSPLEEGMGIDGFINGIPYSIKAESYKNSIVQNIETINAVMVYYRAAKIYGNATDIEYYIEEDTQQ